MDDAELDAKIKALLDKVRSYNPNADFKLIEKAARFANRIHAGQKRLSGEEYFIHCYSVGLMLAGLKLGSHTIAAGILHGTLEDGNVKPEVLEREFDKEMLVLIQAISRLKNVKSFSQEAELERRAENIRKIMLASSKDIRVIIIKLVDRLHSMQTLKYLPEDMRKIISTETMTIYAPIADKLGMYNIKAELEDLAFRFLENQKYLELKEHVAKKKEQREKEIERIMSHVHDVLKNNGIHAEISGRAKHFYSIYKKINLRGKQFDEIYDLMAIRVIVDTVDECYKVLGIIHGLWKPMPDRLKDYIALPKANGYRSIHTGVFTGHGSVLEVQIRTKEMHKEAEEGIAAHWSYTGYERDKKFDRHIALMKQILDWQRYSDNAQEFIESLKIDLFEKEIFVFTPKGDPIALPENATPVDFAYAVHTDIGNHCKQAKVNGAIVPLDYTLSPGDVIEILTQKNALPSRSWLSFVKSAHTRTKIRAALDMDVDTRVKKKEHEEIIDTDFPEEILIEGKKYDLKIPKCCTPRQSDTIRAFKTKDGKIVAHKSACPNVYTCDLAKEVHFTYVRKETPSCHLRIDVKDKIGILGTILDFLSKSKHIVESVNTRIGRDGRLIVTVDIHQAKDLDVAALILELKKIDSVINSFVEDERHTQRFLTSKNEQ